MQPDMDIAQSVRAAALRARKAAGVLAKCTRAVKDAALLAMAERLLAGEAMLLAENAKDVEAGRARGLSAPLLERLTLNPKRIAEMAAGLRDVASLPDPVGEIMGLTRRPNGMQVGQMRAPIGLIGIIYESRPNVTADVAALCIKSGNGVLLRGGSEALQTNLAIARLLQESASKAGLPSDAITLIESPDRKAVIEMLKLEGVIDLVIPRGGEALMREVAEHARMPVIKHDKGLCHIFVDASADMEMAEEICVNAKTQRPSTCNAMETLLVHRNVAPIFLPQLAKRLREVGCEMRGCPKTQAILPDVTPASEEDFHTEYLALILSVKVVDSLDAAMAHIATYGSAHSEAILTQNHAHAMRFLNEVDASAVLVNASTRLNDGFQFGLGAEMGISTSRIHVRGPMGLEALTCAKFIVLGSGQIRTA
jgi:glutamate-5-semialdehyde dehydrogenase